MKKCSRRMKGSVYEEWKEVFMKNEWKCSYRMKGSVIEEWKEVFVKRKWKCPGRVKKSKLFFADQFLY